MGEARAGYSHLQWYIRALTALLLCSFIGTEAAQPPSPTERDALSTLASLLSNGGLAKQSHPLPFPHTHAPVAFSKSPSSSSSTSTSKPTGRRRWGQGSGTAKQRVIKPDPSSLLVGGGHSGLLRLGPSVLLPLFAFMQHARASPYDPHPLPILLGLCFFNGWYIRVTDHDSGLAFAVIVGSFKHKGADAYTEHYLALLYADKSGNFVSAHAFPDPDSVTITVNSDGYSGVPANFTWRAADIGELRIEDGKGRVDFRLPAVAVSAIFRDRVPWDPARPNSGGPEGWLGKTFLLPCRYYVHSLASKTVYRVRISDQGKGGRAPVEGVVRGRGFAHMESNYGNHFPSGWIWVQAIKRLREVQLVMVGGNFEIGPLTPNTWIIGYRSPRFRWDFRTTEMDKVDAEVNYSSRTLRLSATSRCGRHKLEIEVKAPEGSFGSPIYVPTSMGFSSNPGCRESFTAKVKVKALDLTKPRMRVMEEFEMDLAALEFGGSMQRL